MMVKFSSYFLVLILLFSVVCSSRVFAGVVDSLFISFAERRAQTVGVRDFEIAFGSGKNQVGYEREEGVAGWLYDVYFRGEFSFVHVEFSDRYRGVYDLSWQSFKLTNAGRYRLGCGFAGVGYIDWKVMVVVESEFTWRYLSLGCFAMTDFAGGWRWRVEGGLRVPLGEHLVLAWRIDHWGDGVEDYGGSKLVLTVKF